MDDDQVLVPPEVEDELERLQRQGDLDPENRQRTREVAAERDFGALVRWLDRVDDEVYRRAASGAFEAEDGPTE